MTAFQMTAPTFTRPANTTAYTAADLIANSATVGSVVPLIFPRSRLRGRTSGKITGASIHKSNATVTNANFRLHLFNQEKVLTNGDNGALVFSNLSGYIGAIDIDMEVTPTTAGGGAYKHSAAVDLAFNANNNIYGYLEALEAYTPTSGGTFAVTIDIEV
jgi:hypothetical protein